LTGERFEHIGNLRQFEKISKSNIYLNKHYVTGGVKVYNEGKTEMRESVRDCEDYHNKGREVLEDGRKDWERSLGYLKDVGRINGVRYLRNKLYRIAIKSKLPTIH
jgi:hypothetical protein